MNQKNGSGVVEHNNIRSQLMANSLRFLAACMVNKVGSGHLGMPLGMADVAAVLWGEFMDFDPKNPNRDRFVLSCGHGSALLYALLHFFDQLSIDDLKNFRRIGSKTPGHPEYNPKVGVELTTGPLGQGLACSIGMTSPRFWTYVFCSDGDLMEGIAHEALAIAARFSSPDSAITVQNLLVFWDDNGITIDGKTELSCSTDLGGLFLAHGWNLIEIDGHDYDDIRKAIIKAKSIFGLTCIRCKTTIGIYAENAGTERAHSGSIRDLEEFKRRIGIGYADFELPEELYHLWDEAKERGRFWMKDKPKERAMEEFVYEQTIDAIKAGIRDGLVNSMGIGALKKEINVGAPREEVASIEIPNQEEVINNGKMITSELIQGHPKEIFEPEQENEPNIYEILVKNPFLKNRLILIKDVDLPKRISTRKMLEYILRNNPGIITGSADLGESTCVGRGAGYLHFGIREHAMVAFAVGRALLGHRIPVATFLSFTDYAKPTIRLAAMMQANMTMIATHDSIGVGEDGPTHQPIEQLWSLRLIPGLKVFRPANLNELQASLASDGPSVIALSRQEVLNFSSELEQCILGGYVVFEEKDPVYTLIATGSELEIAFSVAELLPGARVVSMPCLEEFESQSESYKAEVLGKLPRFCIEAGVTTPWSRYVDLAFGIDKFGESGSCIDLFNLYLDPKAIASKIESFLQKLN